MLKSFGSPRKCFTIIPVPSINKAISAPTSKCTNCYLNWKAYYLKQDTNIKVLNLKLGIYDDVINFSERQNRYLWRLKRNTFAERYHLVFVSTNDIITVMLLYAFKTNVLLMHVYLLLPLLEGNILFCLTFETTATTEMIIRWIEYDKMQSASSICNQSRTINHRTNLMWNENSIQICLKTVFCMSEKNIV